MNEMDVCLLNNHLPHISFMSHISFLLYYSWDCLTATTAQKNAETNLYY